MKDEINMSDNTNINAASRVAEGCAMYLDQPILMHGAQ